MPPIPRIELFEKLIDQHLPHFESRVGAILLLLGIFLLVNILVKLMLSGRIPLIAKVFPASGSESRAKFGALLRSLRRSRPFRYGLALNMALLDILFIALLWSLLYKGFMIRPYVVGSNPGDGKVMNASTDQMRIWFDLPIDADQIKLNISPEVEGEFEVVKMDAFPWLSREIRFIPKNSFEPGRPVVIYLTGIRGWLSGGKLHEHAIEFTAPPAPSIVSTDPVNNQTDVEVEKPITINYDHPLGDHVKIQYELTPAAPFTVERVNENSEQIHFNEPLLQDQNYVLTIFRTLRTYSLNTGEDIEVYPTENLGSISFYTVKTPLLADYQPKGDTVLSDTDVVAIFDQIMDKEDVEKNFSIEPEVKGSISWPDDNTFLFNPENLLEKEKEYRVSFAKGIRSGSNGRTDQDINFSFKTIGKASVSTHSPMNGSTGISVSGSEIVILFNQEVDHESAQSNFKITPTVSGSFRWDGNHMIFQPATLAYSTKYTVTLQPGIKSIHGIDSEESFTTSFTTRSNRFSLDFPWYKQQEGFTCNIAATRMALAYRGIYVSESDIKNGVGIGENPNLDWVPGYGVHIGPIASYVGQYRGTAIKTGWNVKELVKEVEKGNPVILWWYNRYSTPAGAFTLPSGVTGYNGMHSEVVYGFVGDVNNPTAILVSDPWRGYLTYSTSSFTSNWAYLNYTALVVY